MSRSRQAVARLGTRLVARCGESAAYVRDAGTVSQSTRPIKVVQGRERDVVRDAQRAEAWKSQGWDRDLLISVADLAAGGITEPVNGDRVVFSDALAVVTETLEIFTPEGERPWRYTDGTNQIYRVHCRLVANS
jgi:hypothetical protein